MTHKATDLSPDTLHRYSHYLSQTKRIEDFADRIFKEYGTYELIPMEIKRQLDTMLSELHAYDRRYGIRKMRRGIEMSKMKRMI